MGGTDHLCVLIVNERKDQPAQFAAIVIALGHKAIARVIEAEHVDRSRRGNDLTSRSSGPGSRGSAAGSYERAIHC
jgi:hypothetical protein